MNMIDMSEPVLYRYIDEKPLRNATVDERIASEHAAETDGGAGVISVDGINCYVGD